MAEMVALDIPKDQALLAAFGEVALRHEQLSHVLRMTIKTLTCIQVQEALDATSRASSSELRERVNKLARRYMREGASLLQLQALLARCAKATAKRNDFIHNVWVRESNGEFSRQASSNSSQPVPSVEDLRTLANELCQLTGTLNHARLHGFIKDGMQERAQ